MPRQDDSTLTPSQLARIRKEAERALQQASVFGQLPTPTEEIMRVARVTEVPEDLMNSSFISKFIGKAIEAGQTIKRALSKVLGIFLPSEGLVFLDQTMILVRKRFVRLHESAHGFLAWQRPMYAVVEDCEKALDADTANLFDREANVFASEVLFQLDTFRDMAEQQPFGLNTPRSLAPKFNASLYASIRQYVSKNSRTCAVVVLNMPEYCEGDGFRATLRRVVPSKSFETMFTGMSWPEIYTPDDQIGSLVPINGRKASRPREIGLKDGNGILQNCVAESFTNTYQIFVLIHVTNALTAKRVLLKSAA